MSRWEVLVPLDKKDWRVRGDSGKGGWGCAALAIPGAKLSGLRSAGAEVDPGAYELHGSFIIWMRGAVPPDQMMARVRLRRPIVSKLVGLSILGTGILAGLLLSAALGLAPIRLAGSDFAQGTQLVVASLVTP